MADEGAIGELLRQLTGTLQQGRDFNLQRANARASATIRIQQFQLDKEKQALGEERTRQAISASKTEQKARELELRRDLAEEKRERRAEGIIARGKAELTAGVPREGQPFAVAEEFGDRTPTARRIPLSEGQEAVSDIDIEGAFAEVGRPVPTRIAAGIEERALSPFARRLREAELGSVEALAASRRAPKVATESQKDRDRRKFLDPNTPEDQRELIAKDLFGDEAMVNGVRGTDISRILNLLYPLTRTGGRRGVPKGIDPNSPEFIEHGADIVKLLGQDIISSDTTLTREQRIKKLKDRGFIIDAK